MVSVFDLFGIGTALSGLLGFVGQERTNASNEGIAANNNAFNASQADIQRQYLTSMSNTAHTREVQDLKNAGLNPLLSVNAGASSPGGATASASGNPTMQNSAAALSNALDTYVRYKSVTAQNDLVEAQADRIRSMTPVEKESTKQGTKTSAAQQKYYDTQSDTKGVGATVNRLINDGMEKMIQKLKQNNAEHYFDGSVFEKTP